MAIGIASLDKQKKKTQTTTRTMTMTMTTTKMMTKKKKTMTTKKKKKKDKEEETWNLVLQYCRRGRNKRFYTFPLEITDRKTRPHIETRAHNYQR